jgi:hypothetical protein
MDFQYGTYSLNEECVDALKTKEGGYAILANIELNRKNQIALIRLNEHGEIINN